MLDVEIAKLFPTDLPGSVPPAATDLPALRAGMAAQGSLLPAPQMAVADHAAGEVPLRLYRPSATIDGRPGLLVFLHGGGWMLGNLDSHDSPCRLLAQAAGCAVLAVGYRLAPEHPFPAGLDDCAAALGWARAHAAALGCDSGRIALGGESAGANLAAALALVLRDEGAPQPLFQLLVHPATDLSWSLPSIDQVALAGFTRPFLDRCVQFYAGGGEVTQPLMSPLHAGTLSGLAPALVYTVEVDPLRDDGERYALALAQAGVEVLLQRLPGLPHGFMMLPASIDAVNRAFRLIGDAVARRFRG